LPDLDCLSFAYPRTRWVVSDLQAGLHTKKTGSRKMKKERKNRLKKLRGKALAEGQKKK
jgi:hypothetical protein